MTPLPDIDAAIGRLDEALRAADLPGLEPPSDTDSIAAVADHVAPYVLPAELRRFWEQADPDPIAVFTFPMLHGPAHALEQLRLLRELGQKPPLGPPPLLLPFDYASHCYGMIELGSETSEGGTIFELEFDDVPIVSHSLADRLDLLAELLSDGHVDRGDGFVSIDHLVEQERRSARLEASLPHPVYGCLSAIPAELESWPAHWLAASGIDLRCRKPLGATHSIAELAAAAELGPALGRVHASVISLVGSMEGARVVVDDGTATLDVWCPSGTSPWGPVHRRRFEFEITIDGPVRAPPDLDTPHAEATRHALAGDLGSAQGAMMELVGRLQRHRATAVATDIRPLD